MTNEEKALEWIASSYKDLMALPPDVRRRFGYALSLAQMGDQDDAAKVLKGFGGAGVLEVVEDDAGGTYRAVYTVKYAEAVFVLHCFQKKSKRGIATPKSDMDIIARSAESGRRIGTGATKCKNESLKASRFSAARATSLPTLDCPTLKNSRSRPA